MGLPTINVRFIAPATSAVGRADRGVLAIAIQDSTDTSFDYKTYAVLSDVDEDDYTAANYKIIARAFLAGPYKVIVVRVGTSGAISDVTAILDNLQYDWVCTPVSGLQSGLVTYVKSINTDTRARKVKCIVSGVSSADDMHIVNVANSTVTVSGDTSTTAIASYLPRLAGVLAACPLNESVTSYALTDLSACSTVSGIDSSIDNGNFCLYADDDVVRIARGVNTLQTIGGSSNHTADMKKICVVEGMDATQLEIITLFKQVYQGRKKNSADNQAALLADIIGIFDALAADEAIDGASAVNLAIDVAAMRNAWAGAGVDVSGLTDAQVKKKTFGSKVFIEADGIRYLDAMEDMTLKIVLG